ncbi:MAG: class I SAM-dependent RNA methyltransferase, partial [Chloroflexota bacterium]
MGDVVAFVAYGLPGERVAFEVTERKPRYLRGRVAEVVETSPDRVTAPCPIFGTCGGCQWQHATYEAQLRFKTDVLRDQLVRVGKLHDPPVDAAVPSPLEWHYRNTVQLVPVQRAGQRLLCFQRAHSHEPVAVEHCYISDALINRAIAAGPWSALRDATWAALDSILLRVVPEQALQITLIGDRLPAAPEVRRFAEEAHAAIPELAGVLVARTRGGDPALLWGDDLLAYEVAGSHLETPAGAFVQVNHGATERLVDVAMVW